MCCAVTSHTVEETIRCGARSTKDVADLCGAGSICGRCRSNVRELLEERSGPVRRVRGWRRRAEVEPLPDPAEVCPVVARAG
jgi:bacterioferritin-associated ferredoxin